MCSATSTELRRSAAYRWNPSGGDHHSHKLSTTAVSLLSEGLFRFPGEQIVILDFSFLPSVHVALSCYGVHGLIESVPNKLAKLRRHASQVHFAKIHFVWINTLWIGTSI